MTRLWLDGEPVRVRVDTSGRPQRFTWQGQTHHIERIWRRWQIDIDWWQDEGRVWRDYLIITTHDGILCELYQDLTNEEWCFVRFYN